MGKGITFNLKHSSTDFDLIYNNKKIDIPNKKKIKVDVPFMNSSYDFSTIGSNGEIVYNKRNIEVKLTLVERNKKILQTQISKIYEWLQDTSQKKLIFDDIADYYFLAECEDITINESNCIIEITAKFMAEPFKTSVDFVGLDIWDTFNFEEDIVQDSEFDVVDFKEVSIFNYGRATVPTVNCDASMSIVYNTKTYDLVIGDNKFYDLKLKNGNNNITINGIGKVKILFRKVTL